MINSAQPCLLGGPASAHAATWAAYIVRWLTAMRAQGIEFWGLTPQNEPLGEHAINVFRTLRPKRPPPLHLQRARRSSVSRQ